MRVLFLYRYGILGGVNTVLRSRLDILRRHHEVHLAFLEDHGGGAAFDGYPHLAMLRSHAGLRDYLRAVPFDVVSVIDTPEAYPDLRAVGYRGVILNETHTTTHNLSHLVQLRRPRMMRAILTPSFYLKNRVLDEFGFREICPVVVVPNPFDAGLFRPVEVPANSRRILLWIGRIDEHKNPRGFLDLCAALQSERSDCEFWMVGGETATDDKVSGLFAYAGKLGLIDRLRWIPRVEIQRMPALYSLAAASGGVFVSTSIDESFCMTAVEALACGCPVAASRVGALPEILEGELAASLFPLNDVPAAGRVIQPLLDDRQVRERFVARGHASMLQRFASEVVGKRYLDLLDLLVSHPTDNILSKF